MVIHNEEHPGRIKVDIQLSKELCILSYDIWNHTN